MSNPLKVIDISKPQEEISESLLEAARNQGFLFIDGHDFSKEEVDSLFDLSKDFFTETSHEEKLAHKINTNNIGYTDFTNEQLDPRKARDYKEGYNFGFINFKTGEFNLSESEYYKNTGIEKRSGENPVPATFQSNGQVLSQTMQKLHNVACEILRLIAVSLRIEDEKFFTERHRPDEPSGCVFRMLRYPLIREDDLNATTNIDGSATDLTIRAGAHTDYGSLTLLFQRRGQQGLQLQIGGPDGKEWVNVPFVESRHNGSAPPLVVNFGDLLSYWTNGVLRSTIHRVKFTPGETRTSDRYSIVFFVHPENKTLLTPVPSDIVRDAGDGTENPTITAHEHLKNRLADTYGWEK